MMMKYIVLLMIFIFSGCSNNKQVLQRIERLESQNQILFDSLLTGQKKLLVLDSLQKEVKEIRFVTNYLGSKIAKSLKWEKKFKNDSNVKTIPLGGSFSKGPENADLTIVVFSDFQCPYCSESSKIIDELFNKHPDKIKVVFKHFPLSFHKRARHASAAAISAGKQGKFWEYRSLLFKNKRLNENDFIEYAKKLNLDEKKFKKGMVLNNSMHNIINIDIALGNKLGVKGTPTIFVNGQKAKGRTVEYFESLLPKK